MGRAPSYDKMGVKKGPWTPEEDTMLVSYVEEHGPSNWRAVPTKTGLRRCSKSCRLRWANYLRPGIKRGTFTHIEDNMIVQLQALLGNKWAAIASYLPERTDNDIKNYWNTHLKKKLNRNGSDPDDPITRRNGSSSSFSRGQWERRLQTDINTAKQALHDALSVQNTSITNNLSELLTLSKPGDDLVQTSSYASSTENIARLLKEWEKNKPKSDRESKISNSDQCSPNSTLMTEDYSSTCGGDLSESFESLFGFDQSSINSDDISKLGGEKPDPIGFGSLSVLEDLFLDDQGKDYLMTSFSFNENPNLF